MDLSERICEAIAFHELLPKKQAVLVAVSGGVDSMVLLHVLHELAPRHGWRLKVAHLNHGLRGRSSDADERLVRRVARQLRLPIVVERGDVRRLKAREGISLEMAARKMRHEFLASTAARLRIQNVALAHQADDQVELFFLRLLRGSGIEGLAGMKPVSSSPANPKILLIRPLLREPKSALVEYAALRKIPFREDASNTDYEMTRNRVRHELLPLLRLAYQPFSNDAILRTMELLRAENEFAQSAAASWLKDASLISKKKGRGSFDELPTALQRRCLQIQLVQLKIVPSFDLIESLRLNPELEIHAMPRAPEPGSSAAAVVRGRDGVVSIRKARQVQFNSEIKTISLKKAGTAAFQALRVDWRITKAKLSQPTHGLAGIEHFDADKVGESVVLRHWRPGDRFQPIGMANAVKLQDLFVNLKIPRDDRHKLVVATAANGQIFWVEGIRISESFKLLAGTTRVLRWHWKRA